jgi:hypothetical protein
MEYVFRKTERNNLKASTFETKSLLYLASRSTKYKDISVLTIDCFNDVSGMCENENIWDVQAKNQQGMTPRKIGQFLITLYENYLSEFHPFFKEYMFFMPIVKQNYIINGSLTCYDINNFTKPSIDKIIEGLVDSSTCNNDSKIRHFISNVLFVEDRSDEEEYIRGLTLFKSSKMKDGLFFSAIFKEIRDRQTALKNSEIENHKVSRPKDVLDHNRYITTEELQVFILNRFIGGDVFSNARNCPASYIQYTRALPIDDVEDHIFNQNSSLSRAFFDKNNQKNFWQLFFSIFTIISDNNKISVSQVVSELNVNLILKVDHMDIVSTRFLVSMIKDGYKYEN